MYLKDAEELAAKTPTLGRTNPEELDSIHAAREALRKHKEAHFQPLLDALNAISQRVFFTCAELTAANRAIEDAETVNVEDK